MPAALLLLAWPAAAHAGWRGGPGSVCRPAAPMAAAEIRHVEDGTPPPLRRAMLSCLPAGEGPRKRPLRRT